MNIPVFDMLKKYVNKKPIRLHMPGHKGKHFKKFKKLSSFFKYDVTELPITDNLFFSSGQIQKAQQLAAKAFFSKESFFSVNGSTALILSAFTACFLEGDYVLIDRNCHISVINAIILMGINPVFVYPDFNFEFSNIGSLNPQNIENELMKNPSIKGIFVTSPNYYGITSDIKKVSDISKKYDIPLIVDEAHGAHFAFCDKLPTPSILCGANFVIQSLHKTLKCPNQTAIIHTNCSEILTNKLKNALLMYQTSSPSFPLIALCDIARDYMQNKGKKRLEIALKNALSLQEKLKKLKNIKVLNIDTSKKDPFRLVCNFENTKFSGYEAMETLFQKFNIQPEMADLFNVIFIITSDNTKKELKALKKALFYLDDFKDISEKVKIIMPKSILKMKMRDAFFAQKEKIKLENSKNRVCGENIISYPPCVPVITYGEIITDEIIALIKKLNIQNEILVVK